MRDPKRIKPILELIQKAWSKAPDLRLTQLLMNALGTSGDPYYIEDDELEIALKEYNKCLINDGRE